MAASASGLAVVGRYAFGSFDTPGEAARGAGGAGSRRQLSDAAGGEVRGRASRSSGRGPAPRSLRRRSRKKASTAPPCRPMKTCKFPAPLAVAIDAAAEKIAVADYQGWQRVFHPRDGSPDIPFGTRFMPSRPTIHVYTAEGKTIRRVAPEALRGPSGAIWLSRPTADKLLIWPHNWTSRGLAGQPLLPADDDARNLYVLDIAGGGLHSVRFPDAIASVDAGGEAIAVGCWDHKVYLLDKDCRADCRPARRAWTWARRAWSAFRKDGRRIVAATAAGTVCMLDADGKGLWRTDLNKAARPATSLGRGTRRPTGSARASGGANGGLAHSDMGTPDPHRSPAGADPHRPELRGVVRAELGPDPRARASTPCRSSTSCPRTSTATTRRAPTSGGSSPGPGRGQRRDGLRPPAPHSRRHRLRLPSARAGGHRL